MCHTIQSITIQCSLLTFQPLENLDSILISLFSQPNYIHKYALKTLVHLTSHRQVPMCILESVARLNETRCHATNLRDEPFSWKCYDPGPQTHPQRSYQNQSRSLLLFPILLTSFSHGLTLGEAGKITRLCFDKLILTEHIFS